MKKETVEKLNKLNREFYAKQAESFSSTRQEKWQGWEKLLSYFKNGTESIDRQKPLRIFDIGCGNGRFAGFLNNHEITNIEYTGVDFSSELIEIAKKETAGLGSFSKNFIVADIINLKSLREKFNGKKFDRIVAFGLMHHIPGFTNRLELFKTLSDLLSLDGLICATLWQFMYSKKGKTWALSESEVQEILGETSKDLEEGDYLLDWNNSGIPRYCHNFSDEEVDMVVKELVGAGLTLIQDFNADGKEGNMNRYLVLKK